MEAKFLDMFNTLNVDELIKRYETYADLEFCDYFANNYLAYMCRKSDWKSYHLAKNYCIPIGICEIIDNANNIDFVLQVINPNAITASESYRLIYTSPKYSEYYHAILNKQSNPSADRLLATATTKAQFMNIVIRFTLTDVDVLSKSICMYAKPEFYKWLITTRYIYSDRRPFYAIRSGDHDIIAQYEPYNTYCGPAEAEDGGYICPSLSVLKSLVDHDWYQIDTKETLVNTSDVNDVTKYLILNDRLTPRNYNGVITDDIEETFIDVHTLDNDDLLVLLMHKPTSIVRRINEPEEQERFISAYYDRSSRTIKYDDIEFINLFNKPDGVKLELLLNIIFSKCNLKLFIQAVQMAIEDGNLDIILNKQVICHAANHGLLSYVEYLLHLDIVRSVDDEIKYELKTHPLKHIREYYANK